MRVASEKERERLLRSVTNKELELYTNALEAHGFGLIFRASGVGQLEGGRIGVQSCSLGAVSYCFGDSSVGGPLVRQKSLFLL